MRRNDPVKRGLDVIDAALARLARTQDFGILPAIAIGLAWAVAAMAVRALFAAYYGNVTGFIILLPAVALAGLSAGRIAGLTSVLGCLGGGWLVVHLTNAPGAIQGGLTAIATINFLIVGVFLSLVSASLRKTLKRLDRSVQALTAYDARIDATEGELRAMVDQSSAGIARIDPDGRILSLNGRFAEILGRPEAELIGAGTAAVTHPDDVQATHDLLDQARQGGGGQVEKRYIRPDGSVVWAITNLQRLVDAEGALSGFIAVVIDVTEAKQAEAALRESETRFRLMADTAPSPVWLSNADGAIEFVNRATIDFYGASPDSILGYVWRDNLHPDDRAGVETVQAAARPLHQPYSFEARFRRHDGVWRWKQVAVNPRFSLEGEFLGYVGMSFDVTQTREALSALEAQQRRHTLLLELSDRIRDLTEPQAVMDAANALLGHALGVVRVGFGEIDLEGGMYRLYHDWTLGVGSNEGEWAVADWGGGVASDLEAGRTVSVADVSADPRLKGFETAHAAIHVRAYVTTPLMRSGVFRAFLHVHSDRTRTWTAEEIGLVEDIAARAWTEVERTRAQAEVAESEARFRAIADTAPVLIWVTRQDRVRDFVNQAYVAFMGGDYESVRTADWRTYIHPDDQARLVAASIAGEATREPFPLEARYLNHAGEYRWLRSFSRPRLSPTGEVMGFVGVAFDVTDARRAEADLKRINELLEERVSEALVEKAKAEADLMHAQRMEAVGRLTGGVAHDFNNLLTVVIGALDLILKSPDDAARRQKMGEAALAAARRGERLTHQLLAFSRRQALRPEPVELNALISEGEPLLRRALGETVEFKLKLGRGDLRCHVDSGQFEAALLNLIVNARDALAERGGRRQGRISVQTSFCDVAAGEAPDLAPGNYVCVTVSDNGVGMDDATLSRVFEPFFTTKAVGKGTGLGLSQVYGFVRQSGGGVVIQSRPGQGSDIRLYLPRLLGDEAIVEDTLDAAPGAAHRGRLLLVEDDASVAEIAMAQLANMGLTVEMADTAPAALARLDLAAFDVVLTDVVMPGGMTGIELARVCAERWPAMRVILTSGYAGEDVDEALAEAPWPFLRKPYTGEQLRAVLGQALEG